MHCCLQHVVYGIRPIAILQLDHGSAYAKANTKSDTNCRAALVPGLVKGSCIVPCVWPKKPQIQLAC
eukprot:6202251-Pleurochrysis_carterae.AAC.2